MPYAPGVALLSPAPRAHERLLARLEAGLASLACPPASARRRALRPAPERVLALLSTVLDRWLGEVRAGRAAASYVVELTSGSTALVGAVLYAAGAEHPAWRRWTALAAGAHALVGECDAALVLGAVAHEWAFVDALSPPARELDASWAALRRLLGKTAGDGADAGPASAAWAGVLEARAPEEVAAAFSGLVDDALAADRRVTADAVTLADEEDLADLHATAWTPYSPSGEVAAAAAALARRNRLPLHALDPVRARYAEPGWASGPSDLGLLSLLASG